MSLRGTAHKGAQSPPLYGFPAWRKWDSPLRAQTDSSLHSADRTEEQGFRSTKGGTLIFSYPSRLFLLNEQFGQICTDFVSSERPECGQTAVCPRPQGRVPQTPSQEFTKGRRLSPFVRPSRVGTLILKTALAVFYLSPRRGVFLPYNSRKTESSPFFLCREFLFLFVDKRDPDIV